MYNRPSGGYSSPPGMTWSQAAKAFFWGSDQRTRNVVIALGIKVFMFVTRQLPAWLTGVISIDDVVGFVPDDPALVITVPLTLATLAWAVLRIPQIHRKGNAELRQFNRQMRNAYMATR